MRYSKYNKKIMLNQIKMVATIHGFNEEYDLLQKSKDQRHERSAQSYTIPFIPTTKVKSI